MRGIDPEVRIRRAVTGDDEALADVHVRAWQTAYRGILPDDFLDALDVAVRVERWRNWIASPGKGEFTLVAETPVGGRPVIAGFASAGPEREGFVGQDGQTYDGEVYAIYLAPE